LAIIYSIASILTMPTIPQNIMNTITFNLLLAVIILLVSVIPNMILAILAGILAVALKNTKYKGIKSGEISKKLEEKRKEY